MIYRNLYFESISDQPDSSTRGARPSTTKSVHSVVGWSERSELQQPLHMIQQDLALAAGNIEREEARRTEDVSMSVAHGLVP